MLMGYTEEGLKAIKKARLERLITARQALAAVALTDVGTTDPDYYTIVHAWEALRRLTEDKLTVD